MIKEFKTLSLGDILPDALMADEQVYATAKALDKELQLLAEDCKQVMHLSRIDELPESVVDLLAWQWHVDFYEAGMDLPTKRRMVKQSIAWHRRKGTPSAVEEVATAVFGRAKVSEWFDYSGEPYHFRIDLLEAPGLTDEKINEIVRLVEMVKNTRSVLDGIHFNQRLTGTEYYGAAPQIHRRYAVAQVFRYTAPATTYTGAVTGSHKAFEVKQVTPVNDAATSATHYTGIVPVVHKRYRV